MSSKKSKAKKNNQNDFERLHNRQRMAGFDEKTSRAYTFLCKRFGPKMSQQELLSLAQVVTDTLDIPLDREASRRKKVLIKWFDENFASIEHFLENNVMVSDEQGRPIGGDPRVKAKYGPDKRAQSDIPQTGVFRPDKT